MILKALYDYADQRRLIDDLPLQKRRIHALIPLDASGRLRVPYLIPLIQMDESEKEIVGQDRLMPRFPGENNGGKAYFLAENATAVFGRMHRGKIEEIGKCIFRNPVKGKNPTKSFIHFWTQIQEAFDATQDPRLKALLEFRDAYYSELPDRIVSDLPFLKTATTRSGKPELMARIGQDKDLSLTASTIGFSVEGEPLTMENESDPLRRYWFERFKREVADEESEDLDSCEETETICLVTGQTGQSIARSHKPKILGIPGLSSGGYIVSFAQEAPSFSSYGFEMGRNAPIAKRAAASYALGINELLDDEDTHCKLGPVSVCSWARETRSAGRVFSSLLRRASPNQVVEFLRAPFAGDPNRQILYRDRLFTVALTGNQGRVVVRHWLDQTIEQAVESFRQWWNDIQIVEIYGETHLSPYSIPSLARVTLRRTKKQKDQKLVAERIIQLYRAALEGVSLSISLLKPILHEFHSALVKNDQSQPTYPLTTSRFALIKLILIRNRKKEDDFMPEVHLAQTSDPAYNLGRLLAVLERLQYKYHEGRQTGAGVIERYYATASSAPASAFPILCRLARNHLSKLKKGEENQKKDAYWIEHSMGEILSRFEPQTPGAPPMFPRVLTLEEQGRFALGFYQQKAFRPDPESQKEGAESEILSTE